MYAVIADRGKQYLVHEGDRVRLDLMSDEVATSKPGATLVFDRVLIVGDEQGVKAGTPVVSGARVEAEVLGMVKGTKLVIFHKRRRKFMRRRNGHRQRYTDVRISRISHA